MNAYGPPIHFIMDARCPGCRFMQSARGITSRFLDHILGSPLGKVVIACSTSLCDWSIGRLFCRPCPASQTPAQRLHGTEPCGGILEPLVGTTCAAPITDRQKVEPLVVELAFQS